MQLDRAFAGYILLRCALDPSLGPPPPPQLLAMPLAEELALLKGVALPLFVAFGFPDVVELESWFLNFPADLALFMPVKDRWITGPVYPTWTASASPPSSCPASSAR